MNYRCKFTVEKSKEHEVEQVQDVKEVEEMKEVKEEHERWRLKGLGFQLIG